MAYKTSTGGTSYQERSSNSRRLFGRGRGNIYGRGWGHEFNPTTPNVRGKCESWGSNVYYIWDARQADKYTKITDEILNYIQGNSNECNYVK